MAILVCILGALVSCAGAPPVASLPPAEPVATPIPEPAVAANPKPIAEEVKPEVEPAVAPATPPVFDPATVSSETKKVIFIDIRAFIESLNTIIQRKDFETWRSYLTPEFIAYYSDPAILAQMSEYPVLKRLSIKLTSLKDYFFYVVYPSRQNDRVDDIEFVGEQRVKAVTISQKNDRQILYNLEKHGDTWKIGIGR